MVHSQGHHREFSEYRNMIRSDLYLQKNILIALENDSDEPVGLRKDLC